MPNSDTTLDADTGRNDPTSPWYSSLGGWGTTLGGLINTGAGVYRNVTGSGASDPARPPAPAGLPSGGATDWKKFLPIGAAVVVGLIVLAFIFKRK